MLSTRVLMAGLACFLAAHTAFAQSFSFTALGDLPYGNPAKSYEHIAN